MRIAVVSSDYREVNQQFAHAERFLIFDSWGEGLRLVEERDSEPLPVDIFDQDMFDWVVDIIKDCDQVYMAHIRDKSARALKKRGILPVIYAGPIGAIPVKAVPDAAG